MLHLAWERRGPGRRDWQTGLEDVHDSRLAKTYDEKWSGHAAVGTVRSGRLELSDHRSATSRAVRRHGQRLQRPGSADDRRDRGDGPRLGQDPLERPGNIE